MGAEKERKRKLSKIKVFLEMIRFEHTVFALPFALASILLTDAKQITSIKIILIVLAMTAARTTAMALNRIIDRHIDAANPRTQDRAMPRGLVGVHEAYFYTVLSAAVFLLAAFFLGPLPLKLAPICLAAFALYPYAKRVTWLSHFMLGGTIGMAPLAAWIALNNDVIGGIIFLSIGVALWIAGFDIIYACADYDFDCASKLYSIPARFGLKKALTISTWTHVAAAIFFAGAGVSIGLGAFYWTGMLVVTGLMYKQHAVLSPHDLTKLDMAFFDLNQLISVLLFAAILADVKL
jgi:4-hydroxybenzoate polyprenyltransferase